MAGDSAVINQFERLVADANQAFGSDFRYAEEMARQAVSLQQRQEARKQKKAEDRPS